MTLIERLKQEFITSWKPFEVIWLALFIIAQIWAYIQAPDSWLAMISGISGILCVVLVSKGKISNYFFGLIFAYTYFYVAWGSNFFRRNEYRTLCIFAISIYWLLHVESQYAK